MKLLALFLALLGAPVITLAQRPTPPKPFPQGHLVIAGGGTLPDEILAHALQLAGGPSANALLLPQSSRRETAGQKTRDAFLRLGAQEAAILSLEDLEAARELLAQADLIWISGGSQNRFMQAFEGTGLLGLIRQRYLAGAVVAGTSAGAAVMAEHMFTGQADLESLRGGTTETKPGLGLLPEALIDQHFHARRRFNRLLGAVLDRPTLVGIGIDEKTAIVYHNGAFEVIGPSNVLVIDARRASHVRAEEKTPSSARDLRVHILTQGMTMQMLEKKPEPQKQ